MVGGACRVNLIFDLLISFSSDFSELLLALGTSLALSFLDFRSFLESRVFKNIDPAYLADELHGALQGVRERRRGIHRRPINGEDWKGEIVTPVSFLYRFFEDISTKTLLEVVPETHL